MPIRILDPDVAAKIAAGEVIERPASVVKELVENALDAGARSVAIEIVQGGRDLIRVTDDGSGIPADEVPLAFQRHATSKIATADDLVRIATLGFRGEALGSIAAVAQVEMVSRARDSNAGTWVRLKGGRVTAHRSQAASPGTSVTATELFHDLPARRKFLKGVSTETSRIHALVGAFALAYPEVRFHLSSDGRLILHTPGNGSLQDALAVVVGAESASQMLAVKLDGDSPSGPSVVGFASPPAVTRPGRSGITLLVNRRWVQSPLLTYAVESAYHGFLPERRHPVVVLNVTLSPTDVDVNVHPAKSEVRFLKEGEVFSAVQRAVRSALTAQAPVPEMRWKDRGVPSPPVERQALWPDTAPSSAPPSPVTPVPSQPQAESGPRPERRVPVLRVLGQVGATYIVAEGPDGLFLIDQHAAHERVLFERLGHQFRSRTPEVQGLLEPVTVELAPGQGEVVEAQREMLEAYGFQVEPFGERTCLLRGVPAVASNASPAALFKELVELLEQAVADPRQREEKVAVSIACHGSVRAGMTLGAQEMMALVEGLENTQNPRTCPHGRPTMLHLSASQLEREFGRR